MNVVGMGVILVVPTLLSIKVDLMAASPLSKSMIIFLVMTSPVGSLILACNAKLRMEFISDDGAMREFPLIYHPGGTSKYSNVQLPTRALQTKSTWVDSP